jgi:uncharacterized protein (TIGR04255 family)
MTTTTPGHFEPLHSAHPIDQVAFVLKIAGNLDADGIQRAHKAALEFADDFPGQQQLQTLTLAFGSSVPLQRSKGAAGWQFQRTDRSGTLEHELRMDSESIFFRTTKYTRWNELWEKVRVYFSKIGPVYADAAALSVIGLNYTDKFVLQGEESADALHGVLRQGSPYFSQSILKAEDLWHTHVGYFDRPNAFTKRLVNLNIDYVDEPKRDGTRRVVKLLTSLTDLFNQEGFEQTDIRAGDVTEVLEKHMLALHDLNKSLLSSVLSDSMLKRIALQAP